MERKRSIRRLYCVRLRLLSLDIREYTKEIWIECTRNRLGNAVSLWRIASVTSSLLPRFLVLQNNFLKLFDFDGTSFCFTINSKTDGGNWNFRSHISSSILWQLLQKKRRFGKKRNWSSQREDSMIQRGKFPSPQELIYRIAHSFAR